LWEAERRDGTDDYYGSKQFTGVSAGSPKPEEEKESGEIPFCLEKRQKLIKFVKDTSKRNLH